MRPDHVERAFAAIYNMASKLVLLEWSESKSDGKFGFSMLKNPSVQIFGAIGATNGAWQHIEIFAWSQALVSFNSSCIKLYMKNLNFIFFHCHIILKKFPCNIISPIFHWYPTIDFFILAPEIAASKYACSIHVCYNRCCLSKSHARVIKRKLLYAVKRHWLPQLLQKFAHGGFSTCWIQICHQICSLTTPAIQAINRFGNNIKSERAQHSLKYTDVPGVSCTQ